MRLPVCYNETGSYGEARSKQFAPRIENIAKPCFRELTSSKVFFFFSSYSFPAGGNRNILYKQDSLCSFSVH